MSSLRVKAERPQKKTDNVFVHLFFFLTSFGSDKILPTQFVKKSAELNQTALSVGENLLVRAGSCLRTLSLSIQKTKQDNRATTGLSQTTKTFGFFLGFFLKKKR